MRGSSISPFSKRSNHSSSSPSTSYFPSADFCSFLDLPRFPVSAFPLASLRSFLPSCNISLVALATLPMDACLPSIKYFRKAPLTTAVYSERCFSVKGAYKTYSFFGGRFCSTSVLRRRRRKGLRIECNALIMRVDSSVGISVCIEGRLNL